MVLERKDSGVSLHENGAKGKLVEVGGEVMTLPQDILQPEKVANVCCLLFSCHFYTTSGTEVYSADTQLCSCNHCWL